MDYEIEGESAKACAQSVMQNAMDAAGVTYKELAERMHMTPRKVGRLFFGDCNLTVEVFGKFLAACGYVPTFSYEKNTTVWGESHRTSTE